MTPALDTMPRTELTEPQGENRPSLADLAQLGAEELSARIRRALPDTGAGAVPVAAFNSSI
ncbi:FxSxx-COOH cyclophane-containing RiPP peptide [Kitasatospora sp. NPDC057940]|uniref:FxSxx-COOH cyclophane-containing RiPP peptide n=1 Tax=Kitasatospora sp. NPDC057940 TaxID=3346285 RepID=UPI0036D9FF3A